MFLQVLRNWGQKSLSNTLNEAGRKLLALETVDPSKDSKELEKGTTLETTVDSGEPGSLNLQVWSLALSLCLYILECQMVLIRLISCKKLYNFKEPFPSPDPEEQKDAPVNQEGDSESDEGA